MPSSPTGAARAVLFDLDDTLLPWQTVAHWQWAWRPRGPVLSERHVLAAIHRSLHAWDRRRWRGLVGESPPADAAAYREHLESTLAAIAGHALPSDETNAVVTRFLHPAGEIETFPDVVPCLARLASDGIPVAVTSSLGAEPAQVALRRVGLGDLKIVATADAPTPAIPAAAAWRAVAESLGLRPREILYVGDLFWSDIRAAARVGFPTALVDRRDWLPRVLARRIRSLADLPAIVAAPGEEPAPDSAESSAPPAGPDEPPAAQPPVERKI
ncbi:MAG TPA: HAD family hydrolase [Thermoplasmata archaeon]|nr:HAD family hydrolase [Thermoplasmata archaeon]